MPPKRRKVQLSDMHGIIVDYSFKALEKIVPEALNSVSMEQIRRYARRSWRFMDAYRKGLHWSKSKKSDSDW